MSNVKTGDRVKVQYTGKLEDGSIFSASAEAEPLEFEVGAGTVLNGLDKAVEGMTVGETKTVTLPADEAFGQHRPEMVVTVPSGDLPDNIQPEVGQRLSMTREGSGELLVTVTEVADSHVTLDGNHPLAGKDLTFEMTLVDIA